MAQSEICPVPPWRGLGLGLHSNSGPMTLKFLCLAVDTLSPVLQPQELPGKQGKAEAPLSRDQTAQDRLRAEHKALLKQFVRFTRLGASPPLVLVQSQTG